MKAGVVPSAGDPAFLRFSGMTRFRKTEPFGKARALQRKNFGHSAGYSMFTGSRSREILSS